MWKTVELANVCDLITCGVAKRPDYVETGIPFLSAKNVKKQKVIWDDYKHITLEAHRALTKHNKPEIGDVLYTRVGSFGEAAIVDKDVEFSIFVSLTLIKPKPILLNKFLIYYLNSPMGKSLAKKGVSSSGVGNLNVGVVRKFPIPLPPLAEQQRIVAKLDAAFAEIDTLAKAKRNKHASLQRISTKRLSVLVNELLVKCIKKPLSEVSVKITKGSSPKWQGVNYVDEPGILFVTSENVGSNILRMEKIKYVEEKFNEKDSKSILQRGDVLTNIVGASIGRTAVFDLEGSVSANINQAVCLIRTDTNVLQPRFLSTLMNSEKFLDALHDGETSMARANISLGFVASLEIPLPSLSEQASFLEKCDTISAAFLASSEIVKQQIELSEKLKSAILAQELQSEAA
ncbi:restriction endonuclease subunit S [Tateyamaria sp.]|nr:restriction endonuclease subunit S [Tateyamaria sp.]